MVSARVKGYWLLAFLLAGLSIAGVWRWWNMRNFRRAMSEINAEMMAGRRGAAARGLTTLLSSSSDSDQVAYFLGVCERARGQLDAADLAWERVTPGSSFSSRAIEARLLLRVRASRFAAAEELINLAALDQRNDGTALRILIVPTYLLEGRLDDALDLIEARLQHSQQEGEGASHTAIVLARLHFDLEHPSNSVDTTRADLERAGRHTPDDDRIWLGRANLAIRSGNFEEAARWLNDCERLRPGDLPVWKARLRLAMAAGQVARVMEALRHLPASTTKEAEVHRIRAWLARHQGDPAVEQQELTLALAAAPADRRALERLSEIAKAAGQTEQLAQLQNHNAEIERMTARYKKLLERNQPIRDSIELGLLAEKLGRPFEARVYLGVAATEGFHRDQASRNLDRLEHQMADLRRATGSLAEIVGAGAGSAQPGQSTARPRNE